MPDFGSNLYALQKSPHAQRRTQAIKCAAEALSGENVAVRDAEVLDAGDGMYKVTFDLEFDGRTASLSLYV